MVKQEGVSVATDTPSLMFCLVILGRAQDDKS